MGRGLIAVVLIVVITIVLIASASSGIVSRLFDMPRRGLLVLAGIVGLVVCALWFYLNGDIDAALWQHNAPARPSDETEFVSRVEAAMAEYAAAADPGERGRYCLRRTAELEKLASAVTDWTGTVSASYRMGLKLVLVVRIGRHTEVRTGYNQDAEGNLLVPGTSVFDQASVLQSGDSVSFSGSSAARAKPCMFSQSVASGGLGADLVFKFTAVEKQR